MSQSNGTLPYNRLALTDELAPPAATRKIAILGKAPSSWGLAPFDDPTWEIWGLANLYANIPRWDRWFELHELTGGKLRWPADYWQWLTKDHGKPLYVQAPHHEVQHGQIFPLERIIARFGGYFTNSISYMLALAIDELTPDGKPCSVPHEIGVWGVDMAQGQAKPGDRNTEYGHQRPSCEYFIGLARGLGIKVTVPRQSELCKTRRLYAFHDQNNVFFEKIQVRRRELEQQFNECQQAIAANQERSLILRGALDDLKWAEQWAVL